MTILNSKSLVEYFREKIDDIFADHDGMKQTFLYELWNEASKNQEITKDKVEEMVKKFAPNQATQEQKNTNTEEIHLDFKFLPAKFDTKELFFLEEQKYLQSSTIAAAKNMNNSVTLAIAGEFILSDVATCMSSLTALLPLLKGLTTGAKYVDKYIPIHGISFILDGLIILLEDFEATNTDPARKLLASFFILGGIGCILTMALAPQTSVILIISLWGISIVKQLGTTILDFLQKRKVLLAMPDNSDLKTLMTKIEQSKLSYEQKESLKNLLQSIPNANADTKIKKDDIEKYSSPFHNFYNIVKSNTTHTNLYIIFSYLCYTVATFASNELYNIAAIGYLASTLLICLKRAWQYCTHKNIDIQQRNPFISCQAVATSAGQNPRINSTRQHLLPNNQIDDFPEPAASIVPEQKDPPSSAQSKNSKELEEAEDSSAQSKSTTELKEKRIKPI